jgi:predicted  nucleic acid-binding Zn-ribbon protein
MSYDNHDHGYQYASADHDHYSEYAEKYHRHYDDESTARGLREDLSAAEERIRELSDDLRDAMNRIHVLEDQTPQARQLQRELDLTLADNAAAGYGWSEEADGGQP